MKMPLQDSGQLKEHSEAKVRLLSAYLRNYLAVVTNIEYVHSVDLYDLFCGRGLYGDSSEGSPLVAMRVADEVVNTVIAKGKNPPKINFYFADTDRTNFETVGAECAKRHNPQIGTLKVTQSDYRDSLSAILATAQDKRRKEFVFIDPCGYSDVRPNDIKRLLERDAEALLFLPIQFMYRFRQNATPEPLQDFVGQLQGSDVLSTTTDAYAYAIELRQLFRNLSGPAAFVSTFMIEKDASTLFCLYFFTTKWQGHVKMIEAKWKVSADAGHGWSFKTVPGQESLISPQLLAETQILEHLKSGPKTNIELFEYGVLQVEFPPSVVNKACVALLRKGEVSIKPLAQDARKGYSYISEKFYRYKQVKVEVSRI